MKPNKRYSKILISNSADVNAENDSQEIALVSACKVGSLEIVKFSLELEFEVKFKNAFVTASKYRHLDIVSFLYGKEAFEYDDKEKALIHN